MSNYYYKSTSLSSILTSKTSGNNSSTNYFNTSTDLGSLYQPVINDNFKIANTNLYYYYGSIDIAPLYLPFYYEYSIANSYNQNLPSWCRRIKAIIIGGGGLGYAQYTTGGGGGQFVYVDLVVGQYSSISVIVGNGDGSRSYLYVGSTTVYTFFAYGGGTATINDGIGGNGSGTNGTITYNGANGSRDGGINGFKNGQYTNQLIQNQNYGQGGGGGNPNDDYTGYINGNSGYVRVYCLVN